MPEAIKSSQAALNFIIWKELKPQQTGTGFLIRHGEVATTSGSTSLRSSIARAMPRRSEAEASFIACKLRFSSAASFAGSSNS
jgi:hypothetical protein